MERALPEAQRSRRKEDERKHLGWLAALLRGGSTGGGAGAVGALDLAASGGMLLAAKGGLAVAAVAAALAGGMVLLGYRSGKVAALEKLGRERSPLFAPKPPEAQDDDAVAGAAGGTSNSLSMLAAGNAGRSYSSYARGDVATAAMAPAAAAAAAAGRDNDADVSGNKAAVIRPPVQTVRVEASAASAAAGSSGSSGAGPATALAALSKALSGASAAPKPTAALGSQKTLSGRHFGGSTALRALGQVRRDQTGAASSQAAGTTYDGSRPSGAAQTLAMVQAAVAAGQAGAAAGATPSLGAQAGAMTPPPPTPKSRNATPWQSAVNTAMMCVLGAAACLMIISKIMWNPMLKPVVLVLAGVAAMLSTVTISMGSMLMGAKYGQTFQGQMFTLAGGLMLAASAAAVMGLPASGGGGAVAGGQSASAAAAEQSGSASLWLIAAGGAALAAAMVGYLSQPKVVGDPSFKGSTPDWDHTGHPTTQYQAPSQRALARFIA